MDNDKKIRERLRILLERRSIRKFRPDPVPLSLARAVIEYATHAPSATNTQGWRFIVVTDPDLIRKVVDAGGSALMAEAPCGILVTYPNTTRNRYYQDDFQSAAAAIQNLLLAAHAFGMGACWICTLPPRPFLRRVFRIPPHYSPIAYVLLGFPRGGPVQEVARRHPLDEIIGENIFPPRGAAPARPRLLTWCERILIRIYSSLPVGIKKRYLNRFVDRKFVKKFEN